MKTKMKTNSNDFVVIKPQHPRNGVRLYAQVPSKSGGKFHIVVYVRKAGIRRWMCDCVDQLFREVARRRNCGHIHEVRAALNLVR